MHLSTLSAGKSDPGRSWPRLRIGLLTLLLAGMTVVLYWSAMKCGFVNYDDNLYVTDNSPIQSGLSWRGAKWAFCNSVAGNWHPLTVLSHMLDCQMFGLHPLGHHLTSVLLHASNTALVFLLLQVLTGATWRSFAVAALFGVHPLHVESVAWVSERKDVLSTCFGLLTLLAYVRYVEMSKVQSPTPLAREQASKVFYGLALLFFALGLMSKPMLVTWPFVMLLIDYWPLGRFEHLTIRCLVTEKIPFFALAAVASVVTFLVQKSKGAMAAGEHLSMVARFENALISYCRYLGKVFWPADLAVFYSHPGYWPLGQVLLAGLFLAVISVMFIVKRRQYPFLLMGWLWFCGTLVPVIGLVQVGYQSMADRYAYFPLLGVFIAVVWGLCDRVPSLKLPTVWLAAAFSIWIVWCWGATKQQLTYWKEGVTLFRHAMEVNPENALVANNLASALLLQGQINEAIRLFQEAIYLKPDDAEIHLNLGCAFGKNGQIDEAIRQFQEAIRLKPDDAEAHFNFGIALSTQGQINEAIQEFQETIRLKPDDAAAHCNLGIALGKQRQIDEAIRQFQDAIRSKPDYVEAHFNLGLEFGIKGQADEAVRQFREVIRLKSHYAEAHNNLGTALGRQGHIAEAIQEFQEAIRLAPGYAEANTNLARALKKKNAAASH